jgi:heme exporter protein C
MRRAPLLAAAALAMLANAALTMAVAPTAANTPAPLTWRIFYYHVPAAWVAYLAFGVTAAASLLHLRSRGARSDAVALASAEIGLVFSSIALLTGLVWARQEFFGYSPVEDPKVISLVVVVFAYAGYLALRASIDDRRRRGRLAAVYGLLALVGVPLSYFASRVSIHPDFTRPEQSLDPRLGVYLLVSTLAFTVLYAALLALRVDLARLDARISDEEDS